MQTRTKQRLVVAVMTLLLFGLSVWSWVKPAGADSAAERRQLAQFPLLTIDTVFSGRFMGDFETYTQDQFPLRDMFRRVKALAVYGLGEITNNGIYTVGDYVGKLEYPRNDYMMDNAAERFHTLYQLYMEGKDLSVYFSVVPDKNAFLAAPNGVLSMDYPAFTADMQEKMADIATCVDISDLLALENYYRTDTHWKQETLLPVAERLGAAMGADVTAHYTENSLDVPFYGVYVGQSALPLAPETITYLTSEVLDACTVTSYDTGTGKPSALYNFEKAAGKDAYELFLSGSDALLVVENPLAKTDKELILFRDSFGSSLAPLLVEGYSKVTLVDIRYISSHALGQLVDFHDGQDVLFLYSTLLLNNSLAMK